MSAIHVVLPSDGELRSWLAELGIEVIDPSDGRQPTGDEIRLILESLEGYRARYDSSAMTGKFYVTVEPHDDGCQSWVELSFPSSPTVDGTLAFQSGSTDLMVKVVHRLSARCGPQVLVPDTGATPLLIWKDADVDCLSANWKQAGLTRSGS